MPNLTIIMPLYNKKKYIEKALKSIFMQDTSYSYQLIIADDASTDGSLKIARAYQEKYPDKIKILESVQNSGLYRNILRAYAMLDTDYFCVLDPDDYWCSPTRIQKSLDFLEANKDFTMYTCNSMTYRKKNILFNILHKTKKKPFFNLGHDTLVSTFQDYLKDALLVGSTQCSVYRNVIFKHGVPQKMLDAIGEYNGEAFRADSFRNILHLKEGRSYFKNDIDAVYNITREGLWQGSSKLHQNLFAALFFISVYDFFDKTYPQLYQYASSIFINCQRLVNQRIQDKKKLSSTDEDLLIYLNTRFQEEAMQTSK